MAAGMEVILTVDSNEHVVKGQLAKQLQNLGLAEAYCTKFDSEGGPASYFRGRHQIDGVWHTSKLYLLQFPSVHSTSMLLIIERM